MFNGDVKMSESKAKCPFCITDDISYYEDRKNQIYEFCCSICGTYAISKNAYAAVNGLKNKYNLLNCISENIQLNTKDGSTMCYWHLSNEQLKNELENCTVPKKLDFYLPLPIIHSDKSTDILLSVAKSLEGKDPFVEVELFRRDMLLLKIKDNTELYMWLKQLSDNKFITYEEPTTPESMYPGQSSGGIHNPIQARVTITPIGWGKVFEKRQSLKSKKVFIAMQFIWPEQEEIRKQFVMKVQEACLEQGYKADIVPEHHTEPIMDKIIAGIKESHFVIADFTFNNRGTYFEAGYARALGIPVIHTVMEGHIDDRESDKKRLHFDIQQINYIRWNSPDILKTKLIERIKAVI
jgi:nucleoside 2-deoxyribosyltransferase